MSIKEKSTFKILSDLVSALILKVAFLFFKIFLQKKDFVKQCTELVIKLASATTYFDLAN